MKTQTIATARVQRLKEAVESAPHAVCAERAILVTEYFRNKEHRKKPMPAQKAGALAYMLAHKELRIWPDELIVGNTTSKRKAGPVFPELHGLPMLEDLFRFNSRSTNPLQIDDRERKALLTEVAPFWLTRFLAYRAMSGLELVRFTKDQLTPKFFLINETGGIGHLIPDHERVLRLGLKGIREDIARMMAPLPTQDSRLQEYDSMLTMCRAVRDLAGRYAEKLFEMAKTEPDPERSRELADMGHNVLYCPENPAQNFHQAVQAVWLVHSVVLLEGLDNGISFGQMDRYLLPYYESDLKNGRITRERAKELLCCLAVKTSEVIPVFSSKITECHGGFLSGQAITIGGTDEEGNDVTNELTMIFLEVMDEVRMRQPNFHARIHKDSPRHYLDRIMDNLVRGVNSPALYNDHVIVPSLLRAGYSYQDAMNYSTLGCVELLSAGKTFGSTDAALVNLPICLEMALNRGYLFGDILRSGPDTGDPALFRDMNDVRHAFLIQLRSLMDRLVNVLAPIERANRDFHPTPFTSVLTQGCIEQGKDVTEGGAVYNFSGVQGVGVTDVGDSLHSIAQMVFVQKKCTLPELVDILKHDFENHPKLRTALLNLPKFGNDMPDVDSHSRWVLDQFCESMEGKENTRGGKFVAGFYSTTTHHSFGKVTGATANGRSKGQPFSSGIAPMNGHDLKGPTAMFNSVAGIGFLKAHNGANVNAKFDTATLRGEHGRMLLESLLLTYFQKGGMQIQLNVLDTDMLKDAKLHPEKYPNLLVRVSGYSAYFNDLSPAMKDEIIARSSLTC
ncbi:MAG: hypothetical protein K9J06_08630 [Flavobacteriales bacterium]|nr:hypothetical protein [Flavobacteriales bacterium]